MSVRIVINTCHGGFGLSELAEEALLKRGISPMGTHLISRHHPWLLEVVDVLGPAANGEFAELEIVEIPGHHYRLREYDGLEWVETPENIQWVYVP